MPKSAGLENVMVSERPNTSFRPAEESLPGKVYRLGGHIELDGRITWAPKIAGRYTPHNNYVVLEEGRAYLIDTGVAAHQDLVARQLKELIDPGIPITIFLTRSEYSCSGNLAALCELCWIEELVTSSRNPFAGSGEIIAAVTDRVRRTEPDRGAVVPLGASKSLTIIPALLRLINTYWVYDAESKTLFTSDMFGHISVTDPSAPSIVDSIEEDCTTYEQVRDHTLMRYHWLPIATTNPLIDWLEHFFATYRVEIIAPTSGCVLKGEAMVKKHVGLIKELLHRVSRESD
jgi:flavorubredoxin